MSRTENEPVGANPVSEVEAPLARLEGAALYRQLVDMVSEGALLVSGTPMPRLGVASSVDFRSPSAIAVPELRGVRVLVVDDDDDSRDLVVSILEKCEAVTFPASSGEQALSIIEREVPDILVSDIGMPGMDGYELVRTIRALPNERAQRVPAVAVTAYARSEDKRRALAEGFQLHVAKPIEPAAFATAVARLARGLELAPNQ